MHPVTKVFLFLLSFHSCLTADLYTFAILEHETTKQLFGLFGDYHTDTKFSDQQCESICSRIDPTQSAAQKTLLMIEAEKHVNYRNFTYGESIIFKLADIVYSKLVGNNFKIINADLRYHSDLCDLYSPAHKYNNWLISSNNFTSHENVLTSHFNEIFSRRFDKTFMKAHQHILLPSFENIFLMIEEEIKTLQYKFKQSNFNSNLSAKLSADIEFLLLRLFNQKQIYKERFPELYFTLPIHTIKNNTILKKRIEGTLRKLLISFCEILDIHVLYKMLKHSDYQKYVLFAGAWHTENIITILKDHGWEIMHQIEAERGKANLPQCAFDFLNS